MENYKCTDADVVLITMGSLSGTTKDVVDELRSQGLKVGLVKLRLYRPFPQKELYEVLKSAKAIGVIDRSNSFGFEGPLFSDVKACLFNFRSFIPAVGFIAGLGGRDVTSGDLAKLYHKLLDVANQGRADHAVEYVGLRWNA